MFYDRADKMITQIFYCDDKIRDLEKIRDFKHLIKYLEEIPFSEENYAAQIAYSWFLYCEGDFIAEKVSYDWKFYQRKWAEKIQLAINRYQDPKISFIVAYSLEISGMDIDNYSDYENISEKCYEFSRKTTQDRNFSRLIEVLSSHRGIQLEKDIREKLFPNDTLIDKYFLEVLS